MKSAVPAVPFVEDLRRKWQSARLSAVEVFHALDRYESDVFNRTEAELDAAWALRQEIEYLPVADPAGSDQPFVAFVEDLRAKWQQRIWTSAETLAALDEYEADALNRSDEELDAAWALRQEITVLPPAASGPPTVADPVPAAGSSAVAAISREPAAEVGASEAAQRLVAQAIERRRQGDFAAAQNLLDEAAALDPPNPPDRERRETENLVFLTSLLLNHPLHNPADLLSARDLAAKLLNENATPHNRLVKILHDRADIRLGALCESVRRYAAARIATAEAPGQLGPRLHACERAHAALNNIRPLLAVRSDLAGLQKKVEELHRILSALQTRGDNLKEEARQPATGAELNITTLARLSQEAVALAAEPLAAGDTTAQTVRDQLTALLCGYLDSVLKAGLGRELLRYAAALQLANELPGARLTTAFAQPLLLAVAHIAPVPNHEAALKIAYGLFLADIIAIGEAALIGKVQALYQELLRPAPDCLALLSWQSELVSSPGPAALAGRAFFNTAVVRQILNRSLLPQHGNALIVDQ